MGQTSPLWPWQVAARLPRLGTQHRGNPGEWVGKFFGDPGDPEAAPSWCSEQGWAAGRLRCLGAALKGPLLLSDPALHSDPTAGGCALSTYRGGQDSWTPLPGWGRCLLSWVLQP